MTGKGKNGSGGKTRREFLKDAGLLVGGTAIGSTVLLAACGGEETTKTVTTTSIPKSGYIKWNQDECLNCGRCLLACAAYHEGAVSLQLSAVKWASANETNDFQRHIPLYCQQCDGPECYLVCPLKAIAIDSATGARYIDKEKCNGCGICVEVCPCDVPRISIDEENMVAIKCDLCKDRPGGPVCVEVCHRSALTLIPKEERI